MITGHKTADPIVALPAEAAYDLSAPFYDTWAWQGFWREHEYPVVQEILNRYRRGRGRPINLLDIGCGTGWYLEQLADICSERVGIDLSLGMLAISARRLKHALLRQADARQIPFPDRRFEAALCTRVLSHVPRIGPAIKEMRRILTDGGILILSDIDASHDYEFTRLPTSTGHIFADTFKHDRKDLFDAVEEAGFVHDSATLIYRDGTIEKIRRSPPARPASPLVGWIGSWRRATLANPQGNGHKT